MTKDCCNINVTETEKGYRIEVTGDVVKEKCKTLIESGGCEEKIKSCFQACCTDLPSK